MRGDEAAGAGVPGIIEQADYAPHLHVLPYLVL
jgi:hypothetical protein